MTAAYITMGKCIRQVLAIVHVVDVDFLSAAANIIDLQRAPCAVPLGVFFECETGVGCEGEEENSSEGDEDGELHCVFFGDYSIFNMCFLVRVYRNLSL